MTMWQQDHPPLSRRQVRDNARDDAGDVTDDRSAAEQARPATRREAAASGGRRVQWNPSEDRHDVPEPLTYVTQARVPSADQGADVRPEPTEVIQIAQPGERAAFRVRDYRPDGRRAAAAAPAASRQWSPPDDSADNLEYRTQGGPASDVTLPVRDGATGKDQRREREVAADQNESATPERTITRRELRALRERAEAERAAAAAVQHKAGEPVTVEEMPADAADSAISAPTEIPELIEPEQGRAARAMPRTIEPEVVKAELVVEPVRPAATAPQSSGETQPGALSPFDALFLPPSSRESTQDRPSEADAADRGVEPAPDGAPFGHWSTQGTRDDADPTNAASTSRSVGVTTGAITTHALVLPSIPESGDHLLTPLSTGEIMVTGSVDLPRSFGSTGAHPALFDHPDVDALIEQSDREDATADSAPVRAIRAVSSTSSTRGLIESPAPRKSRLPLILGTTAGGALLVVVSVVGAGFIFNVF